MLAPDRIQELYEELADRAQRRGDPGKRDIFLTLAADAALGNGRADQAERLRLRLVELSPHSMLSPFASLSEALMSRDVRDYLVDLRQEYPPDKAGRLLAEGSPNNAAAPESPFGQDIYAMNAPAPSPPASPPAGPRPPSRPDLAMPPTSKPDLVVPPLPAKQQRRSPYENPDYGPKVPEPTAQREFDGTWIVFVLAGLVALVGLAWLGYVVSRPFLGL